MNKLKNRSFTLTEILIVTVISFFLFGALIRIMTSSVKGSTHGVKKMEALQRLALFLENFQRNVENATEVTVSRKKITMKTALFSKSSHQKIHFKAAYEVITAGGKTSHLTYEPTALGASVLPRDLSAKVFFKNQLKNIEFKALKADLGITLPGDRSGFRLEVYFFDQGSKAKLRFRRTFYPPLIGGNNTEDGYKSLREY